jgi:hypothetical protein
MVIQINNKRIIDFCAKHPSFDLEKTVLSFIDFIDNTHSSANPSLDSNLASQILTNLKTLQQQVQGIDSTISIKQNEYINKSIEIKKEYIDDVKNILMLNNNEKIVPIIKEYNETFINKLSLLFKDLIPKEQQAQTMYLQTVLKNIEQNVAMEMNKGVNQESIDRMLCVIDQKFANILTHSEQKITNVLSTLSQNKQDDNILHTKLDSMLDKLGKTSDKGKISENLLEFNLQEIYPTAEIKNVAHKAHSGDFWLIRKDKPTIIVENKNYKETVYGETVQKFIDDMNNNNLCGIMISQNSKIVHKNNFEIEIHNGNVAVYIHECNYDPNKIKIAVHIIDTFKNKIEKNKNDNATIHIDKDILEKINREFQLFNNKKRQHIAEIKNMYDTLTKSAEDMEMDALDELLESQGLLTNVKKYICGNCPRTFKTQKGLDTHERLCSYNQESKGLKCEHCDEIAKTIKGLKSHYRKKHNMELKDDTCLDCCSDSSN